MATHTILLVQSGVSDETRFYSDFDTLPQCLEGICKIYEERLRRKNPHVLNVTYDIGELFHFMEGLFDISCLVYEESTQSYSPHTREWLKERVYVFLQRQATTTKRSGQ